MSEELWLARFPYGDTCGGALEVLRLTSNPKTVDDLQTEASAYVMHVKDCPGCQARYGGIRRLN